NDSASRPKNLKRETAAAAIVPRTRAIPVAARAAFAERRRASRASWSCQATRNQRRVKPWIGQLWMFDGLKAERRMIASGTQRNSTTSKVQAPLAPVDIRT